MDTNCLYNVVAAYKSVHQFQLMDNITLSCITLGITWLLIHFQQHVHFNQYKFYAWTMVHTVCKLIKSTLN